MDREGCRREQRIGIAVGRQGLAHLLGRPVVVMHVEVQGHELPHGHEIVAAPRDVAAERPRLQRAAIDGTGVDTLPHQVEAEPRDALDLPSAEADAPRERLPADRERLRREAPVAPRRAPADRPAFDQRDLDPALSEIQRRGTTG